MYQPFLDVDLTTRSVVPWEIPRDTRDRWIGGVGLGLFLLSSRIRRGMRSVDPECPVFVVTGPLTGTAVPQSSDWLIVTLNADTASHVSASHAHGFFGARLRQVGWDGIAVRGVASSPVYLYVHEGGAELRPADHLWGLDTFETQRRLLEDLGQLQSDLSVACIGQAGEALVAGASVRADFAWGASQGGSGVAWGAKRLKAIAVAGTGIVPVADASALEAVAVRWLTGLHQLPGYPKFRNFFGLKSMTPMAERGGVMARNFTDTELGVKWGRQLARDLAKWKVEALGSWNCEAACHYRAVCTTGPMAGVEFAGFGGEVMEEVGPNLGIEDPGTAFMLCGVVDGYGMAASSAPRTIAMLMEAYEAGEIGPQETDGLELTWGNAAAVLELLERTVKREGLGELIAQGLRPTADALGIAHRAVHMHGTGFNDHDLRLIPMMLFQSQVASGAGPTWQSGVDLAFGVSPEPDLGFDEPLDPANLSVIAWATYETQKKKMWDDSLGVCMNATAGFEGVMDLEIQALRASSGLALDPAEALRVGERIVNLQRLMVLFRGYRPEADFDISPRLLEKIPDGPGAGMGLSLSELEVARDAYYALMRWSTETGGPGPKTLADLEMDDISVGAE